MKSNHKRRILANLLLLAALSSLNGINVSFPELNNLNHGQSVEIPISVSDLSGTGAISYYADIRFSETVLDCTGVIKSGTLTSGWGAPTVNTSENGRVTIGAYGTLPLSGQGVLIKVVFTVVGTTGQGTPLNFMLFRFNEGTPGSLTQNGYVSLGTPVPPSVPTLLSPPNAATDIPVITEFSWNPAANARYYHLQVATTSSFSSGIAIEENSICWTWFQAAGLMRGTTYYWRVRSIGVSGNSSWSQVRNFSTSLNHLPQSQLPDNITIEEDGLYGLDIQPLVSDEDGDPLTIAVSSSTNINASVDLFYLELSPSQDWSGTENVIVSIFDGFDTVQDTIVVTVTPVNDPPIWNLPDSVSFEEDGQLSVDLSLMVSDMDSPMLFIEAQNNNHISVYFVELIASFSAEPDWYGTEVISLVASDGSMSSTAEISVIVTPVNDAPLINIPTSFTFIEDGSLTVNMVSYINDVDSPDLLLTTQNSVNISASVSGLSVTFTATADWFGTESVTFTVSDGSLTADDQTDVIVVSDNDPPEINLPPSIAFPEDGSYELDITELINDVDDTDLTVSVQNSAHISVNLTGLIAFFSASDNWFGTETVQFMVSDGQLADTESINVNVTPVNDSPVINLPESFSFNEDDILVINMSPFISDLDNTNLTLTAAGNAEISVAISGTTVTMAATLNWHGSETLVFTVNDNMGKAVASDSTVIHVNPVNDAPVIDSYLPVETNLSADLGDSLEFSISVSDVDSDLSYSWFVNGLNQGIDTDSLSYQFTQHDTYQIKAVVSDGSLTDEQLWTVIVAVAVDDNNAPALCTQLRQNYPNPFSASTVVSFSLKSSDHVTISVFNTKGQLVSTVTDKTMRAGSYTVNWNARDTFNNCLPSGTYFFVMETTDYKNVMKATLVRSD